MKKIIIKGKSIGFGQPCYIVAEMSANHRQNFDQAVKIIKAAKQAGADAIKLQTYTPDTITIDCNNEYFQIKGTIWDGRNLYDLYNEAYMPWEWQPKLKEIANELGMDLFSTPFDETAVEFLEEMNTPVYKIASFEIGDLMLLRKIARTGKPIIMSTGMATLSEIDEAVTTIKKEGGNQLVLLKCTSAYPAPPEAMNLSTIPHMSQAFSVPVGLSDHTMNVSVPVVAVTLGACVIEKHFTLSRDIPCPDSSFSLEPEEFKAMVQSVRVAEKALGAVHYHINEYEQKSRNFRRSLFVVHDIKAGDKFTLKNVKSIRPGYGLHPRYLDDIIGLSASRDIKRGTPLKIDMIKGN